MAGSLALAPVAFASEAPKPAPLPLHQVEDLPLTAKEFGEKGECPPVPAGKDGWHFVLPGSGKGDSAVFTKLTVEFQPGGVQTITTFGPPSDKHAYATSEPGAKLVAASAEVSAPVKQGWFNLSHTCPATPVSETTPPVTETPGTETPGTETPGTETPGTETPGTETPGTESPSPSETTPGSSESPGSSETPGGTESPSATAPAGETGGTGGTGSTGGGLAETGSSAPVGVLAAVAVALAGAGAFLVTRRRKAQQH
ncbi:LPXTG cell wall anchor domain-containing protein [Streptomyces sp. NBC_00250]|uniref:LPXTG cell wall anchor domain-containing protein n=1 Tax=Streptomyces sp. NBC_00250 TaxID=2903641 RepID=UPI002E2A605E|nr:LPXTG cell wall anchor domain-containing protein [Streptomyces sp. NBC_00250]